MSEKSVKYGRAKKFLYAFLVLLTMGVFAMALPAQAAVKLSNTKVTLDQGEKKTLKVKGTAKKVTWSSSNKSIASVSSKGVVTAKKAGTAKITAKVGSKKYTCKVTVRKVRLSASSAKIARTEKLKLKLIGTKSKVTWVSSNKKIAAVSSSGTVTGKKTGKATITAKAGGKKYTCKVTVVKCRISETSAVLTLKGKLKLKTYGLSGKVTWSSSNKKAATVTSKGVVTAKGTGKTTITAKSGKDKLVCKVTVKNIRLNRTAAIITAGDKITLKVKGTKAKVVWSSSNKKIATVSSKGVVKSLKSGRVTITAKVSGITLKCKITIAPEPLGDHGSGNGEGEETETETETEAAAKIRAEFSVKDVTNGKELPGAHLAVRDETGKVVEEWDSTNTTHVTEKLTAGKYTLTEVSAPKYYEPSADLAIDIAKTENLQHFEIINLPYREVYVSLKGPDGAELPGASLEIRKAEDGDAVDTWISGIAPHTAHLAQGNYILKEVLTPYGYETAKDISFTVSPRNTFGDTDTISLQMHNAKAQLSEPEEPDDWPTDWKEEDWEYTVIEENEYGLPLEEPYVMLDGYLGNDQDVICPSELEGLKVESIVEEMFADNTDLHSIVLPAYLKAVPQECFKNCVNLRSVRMPDSVQVIEFSAFELCVSLKTLDIPDGLKSLGAGAFSYSGITSLEFPAAITDFDPESTLTEMYKLKSVAIADGHPEYESKDGILYRNGSEVNTDPDWKEMVLYPLGRADKNLDVPDGVNAFSGFCNIYENISLETITVPESFYFDLNLFDAMFNQAGSSVKTISVRGRNLVWHNPINQTDESSPEPETASEWKYTLDGGNATLTQFIGNTAEVTVPDEIEEHPVTAIGSGLFTRNGYVKKVTLPSTIKSVPARTFVSCTSLEKVIIQEGVTSLDNNAFVGCGRLKSVTLPDSLTTIVMPASQTVEMNGISTFSGTVIETLDIPKNFETLPVFSGMSRLKSVTVDEENALYRAENGVVYSKTEPYTLIYYPEGKSETSYEIPDGVTALRKTAAEDEAGYKGFHALDNPYLETLSVPAEFDFDEEYFAYLFNHPKYSLKTITQKGTDKTWTNPINQTDEYEAPGDGSANEQDWSYKVVEDEYIQLTKYKGNEKNIVFPTKLEDLPVLDLGENLLKGNTTVESVVLPEELALISENCFNGCINLKSVEMPDSVTSILSGAFAGCKNLRTLTLPEGLVNIFDDALSDTSITTLRLPKGYSYSLTLMNVPKLESVEVDPENPVIYAQDGVLYSKTTDFEEGALASVPTLLYYPEGKKDTTFNVPDEIETFDYSCLIQRNRYLETITVSDAFLFDESLFDAIFNDDETGEPVSRVKSISMRGHDKVKWINPANNEETESPQEAFDEWTYETQDDGIILKRYLGSKEEVTCPASLDEHPVKGIAPFLFSGNSRVKSVTLPEGITTVPTNAFYDCANLKTVTIPEGVTKIETKAFAYCYSLKTVNLPTTLKEFGTGEDGFSSDAFEGTAIEELNIPKNVTTTPAFSGMLKLKKVTVDPENERFHSVDGAVFDSVAQELVFYPAGKTEANYDVPEGTVSFSPMLEMENRYVQTFTVPEEFNFNERVFFMLFGAPYLKVETITVRGEDGQVWYNPTNVDDAPFVVRKDLLSNPDEEGIIEEEPLLEIEDETSDEMILEEDSGEGLIEEVLPEKDPLLTENDPETVPETEAEILEEEEIVFEDAPDPQMEVGEEFVPDELPVIEAGDGIILEEDTAEVIG